MVCFFFFVYSLDHVAQHVTRQAGGACHFYAIRTLCLVNCSFSQNTAVKGGGAICIEELVTGLMKSCMFENNTAGSGGAIFLTDKAREKHIIVMENCTLKGNAATYYGGALFSNGTSLNVSHSDVTGNGAPVGTAIYFEGMMSELFLTSSCVCSNTFVVTFDDTLSGSAIYSELALHVMIIDVKFKSNQDGGALRLGNTRAEVHNSLFHNNIGIGGGAISTKVNLAELILTNTSFVENRASYGATMLLGNGNVLIQSCSFQNNMASTIPAGYFVWWNKTNLSQVL